MGKHYRQLTDQDRTFLQIMFDKGYAKTKIATILGVHRSTIHRELRRNSVKYWYRPEVKYYYSNMAHKAYLERRKKGLKLEKDERLRDYVQSKLKSGWSPWQIEGRLKIEHNDVGKISHESIYRYVYSDNERRYLLHKYLRRKHRCRLKKNQRNPRIPKELRISARPEGINNREEFGHWECDLMVFKRGIKTNLITIRERKTRFMLAIKNSDRCANTTAMNIITALKKLKNHVKSITFDQGVEFSKHEWIRNCIETDIYFCDPASPYQKGAIENGNAAIRLEFQRDYDANAVRQRQVDEVIKNINNRPLKCLSFNTPAEAFKMETQIK